MRLADEFRDRGAFSEAARHYAKALRLSPGRTDIKIQLANMLKDSGSLARAELMYQNALADDPGNADIYLQLGHVEKLQGNRNEAIVNYRRAIALDPLLASAQIELSATGETAAQLIRFEHQMRAGGVDALVAVRSRLDQIALQIADISATLPDARASLAFPIEVYGEMRRVFDCPEPGGGGGSVSIAVIVLADREPLGSLHDLISSVSEQTHGSWFLVALGSESDRRAIVARAAARDSRITWVDTHESRGSAADEILAATSCAADWVFLLSRGAQLHRLALSWIAAVAARTDVNAIVMDEEVGSLDSNRDTLRPVLRQIVDPDTVLEANVLGENVAVAIATLRSMAPATPSPDISAARAELLLALVLNHRVVHIPLPLVRTPEGPSDGPEALRRTQSKAAGASLGESKSATIASGARLQSALGFAEAPRRDDPRIAVIIPTKDNTGDLVAFVDSLITMADAPDALDILILNNGSGLSTNEPLTRLAERVGVTVVDLAEPFNWSRFNNLGATMTTAPILLFANDDMLMLTRGWDHAVRSALGRSEVGVLGARLLYPDDTIQHAGVLFNWRGSVIHDGIYRPMAEEGPGRRWHVTRSVSAVTGAFLATRRSDFQRVGGFDEAHLAVSYNDLDYALKQRSRGLRIIWTPKITLYHFESKTRGLDHLSRVKVERNAAERRILEARWPGVMLEEPSLNPFWQQATLPHRLLAFPSRTQIWKYIERGSLPNPWIVAPPLF